MKIVVCIKQVPDTTEIKLDPVTGTLIRDGVPSIMNPDDKGGLEFALQLKDQYGAHVTVITMGPPQAEAILREAYAMGVDRAILLSDRKFGGADTLATSNTIAAALRSLEFDLLITGRQAIDGDTAQVGPQIAEKLDLPQVTYVEEFHIEDNLKDITVKRQLEDGYELIGIKTPCMLTAIKELNEPRYMNMKGIFGEKNIKIWNAKDIEVDLNKVGLEASPTNVFRSFTPAPKAPGQVVAGDTENEQAKNLLVQLKGKHII